MLVGKEEKNSIKMGRKKVNLLKTTLKKKMQNQNNEGIDSFIEHVF